MAWAIAKHLAATTKSAKVPRISILACPNNTDIYGGRRRSTNLASRNAVTSSVVRAGDMMTPQTDAACHVLDRPDCHDGRTFA